MKYDLVNMFFIKKNESLHYLININNRSAFALSVMKPHQRLPMSRHKYTHKYIWEKRKSYVYENKSFIRSFFLFIISFSHRTHRNTAGSEFKNPTTLDMRQTNDHVGIKNPTKYHALEARLAFCAHMSRAAERRNAKVELRKASKIKTDRALRK